ncbi:MULTISPECIES: sugar ABC transporter substrate-binding protein [unclassified Devosia]|jgi:multiple sugar transport system substrate-binding protein|uniref:ABC transporter substrate-binding protein n=1 Tax=unclassified Devosia TaxID=196773 RepID=UPI00086F8605|nr:MULTISPECIES: sugar ABC transporter substrate-binding protein [unclassified Devosia]MBN9360189.1 sugar ABC transporter substrate-binding protein [Devosia sp.]ODS87749.1 MAG: ABC transporter substrate-binding protein [Devosia sp. SCN 66-27]OJX22229.1 MAG: ABC transporter substrate-binding protein [Devosia sp. 66-14]
MQLFQAFTRSAGAVAVLLSSTALVQAADVSFLTHWAPDTVAKLEAAAATYTQAHPDTKITVRAVPFGDLLTTLRTSGGGAGGATIAGIYDAWLPDLAKDKLVAAVPEAIAADTKANWPAGVIGAASIGGVLYGIPNEIDVYALNYNKKLFAEAGIAEPPKTWDEFLAAAEKLTDKAKGQQGFGLINSWAAGVLHPFSSLLVSNGGDLVVDGKPTLDSEAAKQTFELYEKLIKSGYSDPAMATADANTTGPFLDSFVSGKTGMIIMANWWESALKAGMGDNFADIATAPIPVGPSGDTARSISYSWMTVVNAKASAEEQTAAWDFLNWLNGPESGPNGASAMGDILMSMGILPSRTSDGAAFADKLAADSFLKGYTETLGNAKPFPVVLGGQEFSESLQKTLEAIQFGQLSAADAQATAQADATEILERNAK